MTNEERITRLEEANAKLRARHDMLSLSFYALLAGGMTAAGLARLKESLIANALNTNAPDAASDGYEETFSQLMRALNAGQNRA